MTMHVNVSDTWKKITDAHVNVEGTWKRVLEGYVNVAGTWKKLWQVVTLSGGEHVDPALAPDDGSSFVRFNTDGTVSHIAGITTTQIAPATDWIIPNSLAAEGAYEIQCTVNSGTPHAASSATGSWLALSSARQWGVEQTENGSNTLDVTIEIRLGAYVLASANYTIIASVEV